MQIVAKSRLLYQEVKDDKQFANRRRKYINQAKRFIFALVRAAIIIGVSYVILSPLIGMVTKSFFSDSDRTNPMVYLVPESPTLANYQLVIQRLNYLPTVIRAILYDISLMLIQVLICSMVGYGFARYEFPLKKFFFGCVILTIIIPMSSIMLPMYMSFMDFCGVNLLKSPWPMYLLTLTGVGLRSGLYIYIFTQFFRGLPKEIEEAAFVDGAGTFYTYFRIMLVNAIPSIITVAIFSMVWQYNDLDYTKLFFSNCTYAMSIKISTLTETISNLDKIINPGTQQLYLYAGVVLVIAPVLILYIVLQRYFMEGVERSGIVG